MGRREVLLKQVVTEPAAVVEHVLELEAQLAEAQAQIAELRCQLFGPKAERLSPEQQNQMDALTSDLREAEQQPPPLIEGTLEEERQARRPRPPRHPVPPVLETETVTLEPASTLCPHCGALQQKIGEEVTEETDLLPARLIRRRTVRPKYACRCGEAGVTLAPLAAPPDSAKQAGAGPGCPYHSGALRRSPCQQMVQWVEHIATWLRPLYDALWSAMKAGGYLQIGETPVKVLDPEVKGKAAQGYLWFFAVPGGDVILEFSRSRGQQTPRQRLAGFQGTIQADAYEVYQALQRKDAALGRIGCLAHARRRFYQALTESVSEAVWFITQIRQLYRLEDEIRSLSPAERYRFRSQHAPPI